MTTTGQNEQLREAIEIMLDAALHLIEGKDDDVVVFIESFFRALASEMNIPFTMEIEPMTAGQFRQRWRDAKGRLANGETP